jgi:hypothetical protein
VADPTPIHSILAAQRHVLPDFSCSCDVCWMTAWLLYRRQRSVAKDRQNEVSMEEYMLYFRSMVFSSIRGDAVLGLRPSSSRKMLEAVKESDRRVKADSTARLKERA